MLPGEMHGFLTGNVEVKVGRVFHFISVSCVLYPVTNRVAVHTIHNVPGIINTASVMAGSASWRQRRQPFWRLVTKDTHQENKNTFHYTNSLFE